MVSLRVSECNPYPLPVLRDRGLRVSESGLLTPLISVQCLNVILTPSFTNGRSYFPIQSASGAVNLYRYLADTAVLSVQSERWALARTPRAAYGLALPCSSQGIRKVSAGSPPNRHPLPRPGGFVRLRTVI